LLPGLTERSGSYQTAGELLPPLFYISGITKQTENDVFSERPQKERFLWKSHIGLNAPTVDSGETYEKLKAELIEKLQLNYIDLN
jgi:hypothetical protein